MERVPLSQLSEATARSSSPPASDSDKENPRANKRNTAQMASSSLSAKRRRLTDRASNIQSRMPPSSQRHNNTRYYDPDQDEEERRRTRKKYRDLTGDFNDSRAEFLQSGNNGIYETVSKANELYENVKQTSDATLDSRLLVNAADLSHRKAAQLALGDSSAGIDVDEFVTKCISFMRRGPDSSEAMPSSTQNRRRHRRNQREADSDDDDGTAGDAMNWDWLGRAACLPHNARPSVSGWLLGPLSVQKRTRQITQRTRAERFDETQAVRPNELQQEDLGQQESSNLTVMCSKVNKLLYDAQVKAEKEVEAELMKYENPTMEMVQKVMDEHNIADDGGIPLFRFCINPHSFGQSVENLFYVSFLVRDGTIGVQTDSRGLPTLQSATPYAPSEAQKKQIQKHQAVFSLDFDTWKELIKVFNIEEPIIPHREEQEEETGRGWHG